MTGNAPGRPPGEVGSRPAVRSMSDGCAYDLRVATRQEVLPLFERFHGYKSLSNSLTYCFAVYEDDKIVAAFAWQPPPPGAAKNICPEEPQAVLALSRMVAVPKDQRRLKHISRPLRRQMRQLIDRTRWPVLVTYSDEGQTNADGRPHNGHVYRCSGWTPTVKSERPYFVNEAGERVSSYSCGKHGRRKLQRGGTTTLQRWEHWKCERGQAKEWMASYGWRRVPLFKKDGVTPRPWASGNPASKYIRFDDDGVPVARNSNQLPLPLAS